MSGNDRGVPPVSLALRLMLAISGLTLAIFFVTAAWVLQNARATVADEIHSSIHLALQLIEIEYGEHAGRPHAFQQWFDRLGKLDRTRRLYIHVRSESETWSAATARGENQTGAPMWFVRWVQPAELTVERSFSVPPHAVRVTIEANPQDELTAAWAEARILLYGILALFFSINLILHIALRRALKPVNIILDGLARVEDGEFEQSLPHFSLPEFDRIATAFNRMVRTLDQSRRQNHALTRKTLRIQEEERKHVAHELHDELGQSLTAIKVLAASGTTDPVGQVEVLARISVICDELFRVVRDLRRRLWPAALSDLGIAAALEDLCAGWRANNANVNVRLQVDPRVDRLPEDARIQFYRIVQECLTNAARHANARNVSVRVRCEGHGRAAIWVICVQDDGAGFNPLNASGFGLAGMRERVVSLGGRLIVDSCLGGGTKITANVPLLESR